MAQAKSTNWRNVITIMSIMILVGAEVFGVAIAAGWAIAGLFELGDYVGYALMVLFSLFAIYILVHLWRRCVAVEPLTGPAGPPRAAPDQSLITPSSRPDRPRAAHRPPSGGIGPRCRSANPPSRPSGA